MALLGGLLLIGSGYYAIWDAWQTGDWSMIGYLSGFLIPALLSFRFVLAALRLAGLFGPIPDRRTSEAAAMLADALARPDDARAPVASVQPSPVTVVPDDAPRPLGLVERVNPSNSAKGLRLMAILLSVCLLVAGGLEAALAAYGHPVAGPVTWLGFSTPLALFVGIVAAVCILVALAIGAPLLVVWRRGRPFIHVDADGLRWGDGNAARGHVIAWGAVRGIYVISYRGASVWTTAPLLTAYIIEAEGRRLVWVAPHAGARSERARDLLVAAVARTGLPLRDATFLTERMIAQTLPQPRTSKQARVRRSVAWAAIAIPLLLVLGILFSGKVGVPIQDAYFATLPADLHATTPLVAYDMRSPVPGWLQQEPSDLDSTSYTFTPDGYRLAGTDPQSNIIVSHAGQYQDAAYEVTVRLSGAHGTAENDGGGLVFDVPDYGGAAIFGYTFQVRPDGTWFFDVQGRSSESYSSRGLSEGRSDAIRTGDGEANTLLVVQRGSAYLFYINGQFVGQDSEVSSSGTSADKYGVSHSGRCGVILNSQALTATFTDFHIYAVRPPSITEWRWV